MRTLRVRTELGEDHSWRVSPLACTNHFSSRSDGRIGLSSPGMKWPRNQPRVFFAASAAFPKTGVMRSALGARGGIGRVADEVPVLELLDFLDVVEIGL